MATIIPEWHERAECAAHGCDPSLEGTPPRYRARVAAEYCAGCPVMAQCAGEALRNVDTGVVRAGVFIDNSNGRYHRPEKRRQLEAIAEAGRHVRA